MSTNTLFSEILFPAISIFFFFGSVVAMVVGVGLILRNAGMFRFFNVMNRWVSTRQALKFAEIPRNIEPALHRRVRWLGTAVVIGAAVSVYGLLRVNEIGVVSMLSNGYVPPVTAQVITESARWFLLAGNAFAILAGIAMLFSPGVLANIEALANKWYSVRQHTQGMDTMHMALDNWVSAYPRTSGFAFVLLGLFLALNLSAMLLVRH